MTGTYLTAIHTTPGAIASRASSARVGNARSASDLRDRAGQHDAPSKEHLPARAPREMSRDGTEARTPLWNGPRLSPAFVAQLLGQVMMASPQMGAPDSAFAAYEGAAPRPNAALFEQRI